MNIKKASIFKKRDIIQLSPTGYDEVNESAVGTGFEEGDKPENYELWVIDDIETDSGMLNISTLENAGQYCSWISPENAIKQKSKLSFSEIALLREAMNRDGSPEDILRDIIGILDSEMVRDLVSTSIQKNQVVIDLQEHQKLLPSILKVLTANGFAPIQKPGNNKTYIVIDIPRDMLNKGIPPSLVEEGKNYIASHGIFIDNENSIKQGEIFQVIQIKRRPSGEFDFTVKSSDYVTQIILDADDEWEHKEL